MFHSSFTITIFTILAWAFSGIGVLSNAQRQRTTTILELFVRKHTPADLRPYLLNTSLPALLPALLMASLCLFNPPSDLPGDSVKAALLLGISNLIGFWSLFTYRTRMEESTEAMDKDGYLPLETIVSELKEGAPTVEYLINYTMSHVRMERMNLLVQIESVMVGMVTSIIASGLTLGPILSAWVSSAPM